MKKLHRNPRVKKDVSDLSDAKFKEELDRVSPVAVAVVNEPTIAEEFDAFVKLDTQAKVLATKGSAALILSGAELDRLKKKYDVHAGGDPHSRTRAGMAKWSDLVKQYGGISDDTANRRIKMAEAAADHLPILREVLAGEADFRLLSDVKKAALEKGLKVLTDGKSQRQLMWDFGLTPEKKLKGGATINKALVVQWCQEYHPEMPAKECQALPTPALKKEFRKWAATQIPATDFDAGAQYQIGVLNEMTADIATANGCKISALKDWIEANQSLGRMLQDALKKRRAA
jgi:hypothetical protein